MTSPDQITSPRSHTQPACEPKTTRKLRVAAAGKMLCNGVRAMLLPLLAAAFAAVLFAAYVRFRNAGEWFEPTAVVAGLVFGATLLAGWRIRRTCRQVVRELGLHLATPREQSSSPQPPPGRHGGGDLASAALA